MCYLSYIIAYNDSVIKRIVVATVGSML